MTTRRFLRAVGTVMALALVMGSCSEVPVRQELTKEQQRVMDDSIGQKLAEALEHRFVLHKDIETEVYLRGIAVKLMQSSSELKDQPAGVMIFRDPPEFRSGEGKLYFLGLPGLKVYVSLEFLRSVDYENELAAALALQIANVELRHLARNLQNEHSPEPRPAPEGMLGEVFPSATVAGGPAGRGILGNQRVFHFTAEEMTASITLAVEMLYRSGYDPRGLSELWKQYKDLGERTIYSSAEIDLFIRQTYRTIARYTPLRNPVIRSGAFLAFKKRIAGR